VKAEGPAGTAGPSLLRGPLLPAGLVPIGAFTLRTHARLVLYVARNPFVLAPLAPVLVDGYFLFSHTRTVYLK
jgi:hypothetical protein